MKFLHSMIRVKDLDANLKFFVDILGLEEVKRTEYPDDNFTLVYLKSEGSDALVELTHNWGYDKSYTSGKNFGHLAFEVEDIYKTCDKLEENGILINRPPRDGYMAFTKTPDGISIELLQKGEPLEEMLPWSVMKNTGDW
jgi:lactoylglutathione lyase